MTLRQWAEALAAKYRARDPEVSHADGRPVGICFLTDGLDTDDWSTYCRRLYPLPELDNRGHKFPLDDSGFDARADWLLKEFAS